jgi:hypothetical protein
MTIEEAIKHCDEKAAALCGDCAEEHRQLASWLRELVKYRQSRQEQENPQPLTVEMGTGAVIVQPNAEEQTITVYRAKPTGRFGNYVPEGWDREQLLILRFNGPTEVMRWALDMIQPQKQAGENAISITGKPALQASIRAGETPCFPGKGCYKP